MNSQLTLVSEPIRTRPRVDKLGKVRRFEVMLYVLKRKLEKSALSSISVVVLDWPVPVEFAEYFSLLTTSPAAVTNAVRSVRTIVRPTPPPTVVRRSNSCWLLLSRVVRPVTKVFGVRILL